MIREKKGEEAATERKRGCKSQHLIQDARDVKKLPLFFLGWRFVGLQLENERGASAWNVLHTPCVIHVYPLENEVLPYNPETTSTETGETLQTVQFFCGWMSRRAILTFDRDIHLLGHELFHLGHGGAWFV